MESENHEPALASGQVQIVGTAFNDSFSAGAGSDLLRGGSGNDRFLGMKAGDSAYGAIGDDFFDVWSSSVTIDGGEGENNILINANATFAAGALTGIETVRIANGLTVDLSALGYGVSAVSLSTSSGSSNLVLGSGADKITGGSGRDTLAGSAGNDTIYGQSGDDVLTGGAGLDAIYGGLGADTFAFGPAASSNTDAVKDFSTSQGDKLQFRAGEYGLPAGALNPDYFEAGSAPTKSHAEFFFNTSNKTLFWDSDGAGAGAGVAIATFTTVLQISDFVLI